MKLLTVVLVFLLTQLAAFAEIIDVNTPVDEYYWKGESRKVPNAKQPIKKSPALKNEMQSATRMEGAEPQSNMEGQQQAKSKQGKVVCEAETLTC